MEQAWVVNNTSDEDGDCTPGSCSLRQAIRAANDHPGGDSITFAIPTGDPGYDPETGQWTIALTDVLPTLSDDDWLIVDATPLGPGDCSSYVIIDATNASYGLPPVTGANKEFKGLVIKNAKIHGVYIHGTGAQGNQLTCSYVVSNTVDGVRIGGGATGNSIGSTAASAPNVISFNGGDGVHITDSGTSNNTVVNNHIGTDKAGTTAWANGGYGVHINNGAVTNAIGLVMTGGSNLISGNTQGGVLIAGGTYTTWDNVVHNNRIGTSGDGNTALPNQDGVVLNDASRNVVGENLISGNTQDGVRIQGSAAISNLLEINIIGTNAAGDVALANGNGVVINGASRNGVGPLNLISGNTGNGVLIQGSQAISNVVTDNRIGTNENGTAALANQNGVVIYGAAGNTVGGENLISGNTQDGVRIEGNTAMHNLIGGNNIGTNTIGNSMVSNQRFGVFIQGEAHHNTVADNVISGNGYGGDWPQYGGVGIWSSDHNALCNNAIGVTSLGNPLPNGWHGVALSASAQYNLIGEGGVSECANDIAWNEGDGVYVHGGSTLYNTIGINSIHDNDDLGINNEAGGNNELPPPAISEYYVLPSGLVNLEAIACPGCTVVVYSDDDGEGRYLKGSGTAPATSGIFNWHSSTPTSGAFTLVNTDANGNTSEFSASPVELGLSIDDALPHVVVNKVPGEAAGPAGNTTVEFVATIVGYDPTLIQPLDVELQIPGDALGSPTQVFYRDRLSDYDGTAVSWTSPSSGTYRAQGIDLQGSTFGCYGYPDCYYWKRRVVFRFAIPHAANPAALTVQATLTPPPGRTVSQGTDWAKLQLLNRVDEIIVTNRTQLYGDYSDSQVTTFLQDLYAFAQGPPLNWSPLSAIYYVDAYDSSLANWNNTTVSYASETAANTAAQKVDDLIEDWIEDSTTVSVLVHT